MISPQKKLKRLIKKLGLVCNIIYLFIVFMTEKIKKNFDLRKLLQPLWYDKQTFLIWIIRSIFFGIQWWVAALMMKNMINALQDQNLNDFLLSVSIMFVVMSMAVLPGYFFRNNNEKLMRWLQRQFYHTYINKYIQLENNITDSFGTWYFNNVIQKWWDSRSSLLSNLNGQWLQVMLRIFTALILFILYTWWIGSLIVIGFFGISFIIAQYWNKKMIPIRKEMREYWTQADRDIIRLIMSKFEILSQNRIVFELKKLSLLFDGILVRKYYESYLKILTFDIQKWWIMIFQIILVVYIGYGILDWTYELWILAMVWMLSNQINGSVMELNEYINDFYSRIIYVEKLRETFDDAPMIQWYDTGQQFIYKRGDIVLDTITYDYGKWEVLKDFSLTIQWGKKTALVGISGSGKSTLIKLIAGYIHPQSGTIVIDKQKLPNGQNTEFVSLQSYYQHIGYLTQEPNVFDGTIYENLTYALQTSPSVPHPWQDISYDSKQRDDHKDLSLEKKIENVVRLAQCEFIYNFPDGLQTHIWEKGIKLSWWQRQRLAIAKIMLKNPQIILLDEPTSALDSFSEEEVTKALENLFQWKTVIIIAHRLQTVKKADEIIVLEWWKIVEQWSHNQLVKYWWQYAKMLELQSGF